LERGASPNTQDKAGETALMAVTTYGNVDALRVLLELGAQPSVKDQSGELALDYARRALKKYYDHFWTPELREIVSVLEAQK
jgi:ankyrin repeat protein